MSFPKTDNQEWSPILADRPVPLTKRWQRRLLEFLRHLAARYGILIVVLASTPAVYYFLVQPANNEFTGIMSIDGPLPAAVRAWTGPDIPPPPSAKARPTPAFVKGVYVSAAGAGSSKIMNSLVDLVERTELNTMVIDIKTGGGALAFATDNPALKNYVDPHPPLGNLADFTKPLRDKGIYLVARIFVFEDPYYAERNPAVAVKSKSSGGLWRDRHGIVWVDPADPEAWRYNVDVAREAVRGGFDEVQFDYVRFPTDGVLSDMSFPVWDGQKPKAAVMSDFFSYLDKELRQKDRIRTSVDLFGLVTWNHDTDMNIGQRLDIAVRRFDWISPMVYPSHYPDGFDGYQNPAEYPYDIVYKSLERSKQVTDPLLAQDLAAASLAGASAAAGQAPHQPPVATMRPWLQDFNLGAVYTAAMVKAQMKAAVDAGASGWLLWNARNVYTEAALGPKSAPAPVQ